jgi:hypothetical protein
MKASANEFFEDEYAMLINPAKEPLGATTNFQFMGKSTNGRCQFLDAALADGANQSFFESCGKLGLVCRADQSLQLCVQVSLNPGAFEAATDAGVVREDAEL